jgi:predicted HicB family RNase H-like nuclease
MARGKVEQVEVRRVHPLAVRLAVDVEPGLRAEAQRQGVTVNALINEAVRRHLRWCKGMAQRGQS